ncbi:hypothetical protein [Desulfosarcina variabilis]|uniref:hypothetical protein n=1 Tax=Desulfosarcina variabilis TaxID=2300 RepID=UPI003AFA3864
METQKTTYKNLNDIPDSAWEALSQKKIYFGHQSVGFNIIDGIKDLMKEYPKIKLNIVETSEPKDYNAGILGHSKVGKNTDPASKTADFSRFLDKGIAKQADAAALKFCYVDVTADTNVQKVFDDYVQTMDAVKAKYPDLKLIHFTVPLTTIKTSWKTWLKKTMGKKDIWEYTENVKKNQYNDLLVAKYKGKEPIVDIAAVESTKPDGSRNTYDYDGKTYFSMVPEYTYDGGHLNEVGRKRVAAEFLVTLVNEI